MANRITEEQKIQINELYYENHNKSLTARTLGISVASVNKYLITNYVPIAERKKIEYNIIPTGSENFIQAVFNTKDNFNQCFSNLTQLNDYDKKELDNLRKEIYT